LTIINLKPLKYQIVGVPSVFKCGPMDHICVYGMQTVARTSCNLRYAGPYGLYAGPYDLYMAPYGLYMGHCGLYAGPCG
jgi:hypothetical protein